MGCAHQIREDWRWAAFPRRMRSPEQESEDEEQESGRQVALREARCAESSEPSLVVTCRYSDSLDPCIRVFEKLYCLYFLIVLWYFLPF